MFNTPQLDIITAQYWWATRVDPCRLAKIMLPKICHVLSVRLAHWACVSDERASTTHIATEAELLCDRQFPIGLAECYQALLNRIRADGALHRLPVVFDARALGNESGSARLAPRVQHALLNYLVAMVRPPGGGPAFALTLVRDRADVFTPSHATGRPDQASR